MRLICSMITKSTKFGYSKKSLALTIQRAIRKTHPSKYFRSNIMRLICSMITKSTKFGYSKKSLALKIQRAIRKTHPRAYLCI